LGDRGDGIVMEKDQLPIPARRTVSDPRPPLDQFGDVSDWLHRRYINNEWVPALVKNLGQVLKKDQEGRLLPEARAFGKENMGVAVIGPSRSGKSALVNHVFSKYIGEDLRDQARGENALYYRVKGDATVKNLCLDICDMCGYSASRQHITRHQAQGLAALRMELAGVRLLVIDELHNALGRRDEPVDLLLKGFLQDSHGLAVVVVGTQVLGDFLTNPKNREVEGRFWETSLDPYDLPKFLHVVRAALRQYADALNITLGPDIANDPHFPLRIIEGSGFSMGLSMRLIATVMVSVHENSQGSASRYHFREMFARMPGLARRHNPFIVDDYSAMADLAEAATTGSLINGLLGDDENHIGVAANKGKRAQAKGRQV